MTDPRNIQRYNAQLTFNGTNWIGLEQFNTLGEVIIPVNSTPQLNTDALFTPGKTTVTCTSYKSGGVQTAHLVEMTGDDLVWYMEGAATNGDKLLIQVEVINVTE